jgi:hypothetical protein
MKQHYILEHCNDNIHITFHKVLLHTGFEFFCLKRSTYKITVARFEVFTAVTMKNALFWEVKARGSHKNRRFGGTYRLHHQGEKNRRTRNYVYIVFLFSVLKLLVTANIVLSCWFLPPWLWRSCVLPKRRFLQEPHSVTSQKTAFFKITVIRMSVLKLLSI